MGWACGRCIFGCIGAQCFVLGVICCQFGGRSTVFLAASGQEVYRVIFGEDMGDTGEGCQQVRGDINERSTGQKARRGAMIPEKRLGEAGDETGHGDGTLRPGRSLRGCF
jgi:hypothetical protein